MAMLQHSGCPVVISKEREDFGVARSDDYYKANPLGIFEPALNDINKSGFPRWHDGKALKMVIKWLPYLHVHDYRVVFMLRGPKAIHDSLERFFNRDLPRLELEAIAEDVKEAIEMLENRKDVRDVTYVESDDLVSSPLTVIDDLKRKGWPVQWYASKLVNKDLVRCAD